ncbi:hypothetical protein K502DRAFT_85902 [Neoconidiobolus thromboides FSU 785]|nr:hypothetical protein K502DRAFT_85902 [Neoconidiobolus thromboides FSU 785]
MTSTRLTRSRRKAIEKGLEPESSLGQLSSPSRTVNTTLPSNALILKQKSKDRESSEDLSGFEKSLLDIKRQSNNMVQVGEMMELNSKKKKEPIRYSEEEERMSSNSKVKRSRMEEEKEDEDHFTWEEGSVSTIYEADNNQINQIEKRKEYIEEEKSCISNERDPSQLERTPLMLRKQNSYFKNWKFEKKEEFYLWKKMIKCCGLFGREYRLFFKYHYWPRKKENFKSRINVGMEKR